MNPEEYGRKVFNIFLGNTPLKLKDFHTGENELAPGHRLRMHQGMDPKEHSDHIHLMAKKPGPITRQQIEKVICSIDAYSQDLSLRRQARYAMEHGGQGRVLSEAWAGIFGAPVHNVETPYLSMTMQDEILATIARHHPPAISCDSMDYSDQLRRTHQQARDISQTTDIQSIGLGVFATFLCLRGCYNMAKHMLGYGASVSEKRGSVPKVKRQ